MPRTARFLKNNVCYHAIARAQRERKAFKEESDYFYYLRLLKRYKSKLEINIFGFCFLPECVHLILQPFEAKNLSYFMQRLSQSYTIYSNKKYRQHGRLWQGRLRSVALNHDEDLFECIKYVEFIPVRMNLTNSSVEYAWSSCSFRILGYSNSILDGRPMAKEGLLKY